MFNNKKSDFQTLKTEALFSAVETPVWKNKELALKKDVQEDLEDIRKDLVTLSRKLTLILEHLDLHYVPEGQCPAKLEKGKEGPLVYGGFDYFFTGSPAKKLGRPKGSKGKKRGRKKGSKNKPKIVE